MSTQATEESELLEIEEHALEHLTEEHAPDEERLPPIERGVQVPVLRLLIAISFPILASAVMVGGVFKGVGPRVWCAVAGLLGIALAAWTFRIRSAITLNIVLTVGILLIGVVLTIPAGSVSDVINLQPFVREAVISGDVLRPPVEYTLGWRAISGWLMGALGFATAWLAIQLKKPAIGIFAVPIPTMAIGAISVPDDAKLASGLLSLALFAIGLGLLSGVEIDDEEQRSLAYELRRGIRAIPMVAAITVGMYFAAQANFLFPQPLFDPTQEAQRPRTVPLTEVPDRVLFTVQSSITGPWRMGGLDVYKNDEWLLPPFNQTRTEEVPTSGIVDSELNPGHRATIEVRDLGGAVLPGLPNMVGIIAEGPRLAYDSRTGNIRLSEGTIQPGLRYTVTAARIPSIEELRNATGPVPRETEPFLRIPSPPPGVLDLLNRAPKDNPWNKLDFVRQEFLKTVVAAGPGTPKAVPPEKVDDMLTGSKEGTPYEIVAGQVMLARWAGIPARIGYGFDGGDKVGDALEIRPKHGASFMEVYFPGYKWLPIIGTPLQARTTIGGQFTQQNENVLASDDVSVRVFVPFQIDPRQFLFEQIRRVVIVVVPIILLLLLAYYSYPALQKAIVRTRRRSWAMNRGPRERMAVAYAEWRDLATDFGYPYHSDTPLMFLDRIVPDEEHTELAWLLTRGLWGDLQHSITTEDANAAEELSRSLKRRMAQAHSFTLRVIAAVSRMSLRHPYAPRLGLEARKAKPRKEVRRAVEASA